MVQPRIVARIRGMRKNREDLDVTSMVVCGRQWPDLRSRTETVRPPDQERESAGINEHGGPLVMLPSLQPGCIPSGKRDPGPYHW